MKGSKKLGIDTDLHLGSSAPGATSGTSTRPYSLMEMVTSSASPSMSAPPVIPSSPISLANTPSNPRNGGNASRFSYLLHPSHAHSPSQIFGTTTWKPKESPCFFGQSTDDVHTWTSLVRHYLPFMARCDAQEVARSVTLLRESTHEWYIGYKKRHRGPPGDWAQLWDALLERFGSNIRSQEAQSTLMSISQGKRPVHEYTSQFEMVQGSVDSYDENMMLNRFI